MDDGVKTRLAECLFEGMGFAVSPMPISVFIQCLGLQEGRYLRKVVVSYKVGSQEVLGVHQIHA
jgi:hypothetical protein